MTATAETRASAIPFYEAIILGAGFSGLAMLRHVRELQMSVRILEAGSEVGGTWYWNKYPGARTDSESWYYCYSFSPAVLQEWTWSERYPGQPEMQKYFRFIADKFDLRKDITFNSRVSSARYLAADNRWEVRTSAGDILHCKFLITGMGNLSAPYLPDFKGLQDFQGRWLQTARWPAQPPDFRGKRVAVIGTGSTGVQVVPMIAADAKQLYVFQRTANYVIPAQNHDLDGPAMQAIKDDYQRIWQEAQGHLFGMPFKSTGRLVVETPPQDREKIFWEGWRRGGFRFLFETFDDIMADPAANEAAADFIRARIREIVKDPATAELLCPNDHPYGGKRPPGGHGYYEAFNRSNVTLVNVKQNAIEEITATGIRTRNGDHYDVDVIVFATGFDGFTGAFTAIDITGEDGSTLRQKWRGGPRAFLGWAISNFPNLLMVYGPLAPFANAPPVIELIAGCLAELLAYAKARDAARIETTPEAEQQWLDEVAEKARPLQITLKANSWLAGGNIPNKPQVVAVYMGGLIEYTQKCRDEARAGYPHFRFGRLTAGEGSATLANEAV